MPSDLGTAQHTGDMPAPLREVLVAKGHLPANSHPQPLSGGRTNRLWRAQTQAGEIAIKVYSPGDDNPLFANTPAAEARLLRHLDGTGLAPTFGAALDSPMGPVLLYALVPGQPWQRDVSVVAGGLSRLHRLPIPDGLPRAPDGSSALVAQTKTILSLCPSDASGSLAASQPVGVISPTANRALLHGDVVPGNIIDTEGTITFIDWQCPACGDPAHDLAIFLSPAMQQIYRGAPLSSQEEQTFLKSYRCEKTVTRYLELAPWFHWRMAAYCLWRACCGDTDYRAAMTLELQRISA